MGDNHLNGLPPLPNNWKWECLENLSERVSVGHVGETSSAFTESDDGVVFLRSQNVRPGKVKLEDVKLVRQEFHIKSKKSQLKAGDILVVRVGQNRGDCAVLPSGMGEVNCANIVFARLKNSKLAHFIGYFLNTKLGRNLLLAISTGSAQGVLNTKSVAKVLVPVPPECDALNISDSLRVLDNKIELNHKTNQTLEQMAQALFKSWFVDFDPVIDNALAAGNDIPEALQHKAKQRAIYKEKAQQLPASPETKSKLLPDDIRALFPGEFEQTDEPNVGIAGWVPKGWKASNIGSSFNVTMGQSPPGSTYNEIEEGIAFYQGRADFEFRFPKNRVYCTAPKRLANKFDTLVSVRAPVGDANMAKENCAIGRGVAAVRHQSGAISFTYYSIQNLSHYFERYEGEGTVFGSINQKDFKNLPYVVPVDQVINKFEAISSSMDEKIELNSKNLSELERLRDTLLPKLISCEISLNQEVA